MIPQFEDLIKLTRITQQNTVKDGRQGKNRKQEKIKARQIIICIHGIEFTVVNELQLLSINAEYYLKLFSYALSISLITYIKK